MGIKRKQIEMHKMKKCYSLWAYIFYFVIVFYSSNAHACPNTLQLLEPCRILGL